MRDSKVAAAIGAVVTLQEDEYEFGIGPLRIRIDRIEILRFEPGWAKVHGMQLDYRGQHVRVREVNVPIDALIRALPEHPDSW